MTPLARCGGEDSQEPRYYGLSQAAWTRIGILALLMTGLFWPNLRRLWDKTNPFYGEPNWGHAICIPIIGLYYLYLNREELLKIPVRTAWSGLVFLLGGILLYAGAIWPLQNDFLKDFGMVVALFGVVLTLCGWRMMRILWFPIVFLVCALPWPGLVYSKVAGPLQELAATVAVKSLQFTGVQAGRAGTKIIMEGFEGQIRTLNVAEACAGMRSLMTFISVGAAIAFLSSRPLWQKIFITLSAIPIAIFCNVMRVTGQGLLDHYVSQELSENFAHQFVGLVMLIPAFFLLLLVCWILDHLFVEEADATAASAGVVSAGKDGVPQRQASELVVEVAPRKQAKAATTTPAAPPPPSSPAVVSGAGRAAVSAAPSGERKASSPRAPQTAVPATPPRPAVASQVPPRPGLVGGGPAKNPPAPGTKSPADGPIKKTTGPTGGGAVPRPPVIRRPPPAPPAATPPKKEGQ